MIFCRQSRLSRSNCSYARMTKCLIFHSIIVQLGHFVNLEQLCLKLNFFLHLLFKNFLKFNGWLAASSNQEESVSLSINSNRPSPNKLYTSPNIITPTNVKYLLWQHFKGYIIQFMYICVINYLNTLSPLLCLSSGHVGCKLSEAIQDEFSKVIGDCMHFIKSSP